MIAGCKGAGDVGNGAIVNGGASRGALGTVRSRLPAAALALAVALLAFAALGSPARAATFTVTSTNDSGEGSLRDAIGRANADPATADVIEFASTVRGQITLTNGPLPVSSNLTINGPGADALTVSGNNASGVFAVNTADAVNISNLTIADAAQGSAILHKHGRTTDPNDGTLTIADSVVRNTNAPGDEGGGISSQGGRLVLQNTTVSDNIAARGGGIYIYESSLTMRGSTVRNNQATFSDVSVAESLGGGGVYPGF